MSLASFPERRLIAVKKQLNWTQHGQKEKLNILKTLAKTFFFFFFRIF